MRPDKAARKPSPGNKSRQDTTPRDTAQRRSPSALTQGASKRSKQVRMTAQTQGRARLGADRNGSHGNTSELLDEILRYDGKGAPVLSVYMNVDPAHRTDDDAWLRVRQLLEQEDTRAMAADIARLERFIDQEFDWQSRALAIFSCQAEGLWHVVPLPVPVIDSVTVAETPYVRPLTELLNSQERVGVALIDREVARFFGIDLNGIQELGEERRTMPKRHKQQSVNPRVQSRADEGAKQNLKEAAKDATTYFKQFKASQVVLAGQSQVTAQFRELLPKAWQELIIGEVALDTDATPAQVLDKVRVLTDQAEAERQAALVDAVTDATRKQGATGTLGLADTLEALEDKKVMTLVIAPDFRAKGYQCENCGHLSATKVQPCPVCGNRMRLVPHAVDLAIRKALEEDAQVEPIRAEAAAQRLRKLGGIGALLRY